MDESNRWRYRLGVAGPWSAELRLADAGLIEAAASELDELGFRAAWIPGLEGGAVFTDAERLLATTRHLLWSSA
jgi:hypothetical protein